MRSRGLRVSRDDAVVVIDTAAVDLEDLRRLVPLLYLYLRHADACAGFGDAEAGTASGGSA